MNSKGTIWSSPAQKNGIWICSVKAIWVFWSLHSDRDESKDLDDPGFVVTFPIMTSCLIGKIATLQRGTIKNISFWVSVPYFETDPALVDPLWTSLLNSLAMVRDPTPKVNHCTYWYLTIFKLCYYYLEIQSEVQNCHSNDQLPVSFAPWHSVTGRSVTHGSAQIQPRFAPRWSKWSPCGTKEKMTGAVLVDCFFLWWLLDCLYKCDAYIIIDIICNICISIYICMIYIYILYPQVVNFNREIKLMMKHRIWGNKRRSGASNILSTPWLFWPVYRFASLNYQYLWGISD